MEAEIVWTERAEKNLQHIYEYISHDSEFYAERYLTKMVLKVEELLRKSPKTGRKVPELAQSPQQYLLEVIYGNYRIIYNPTNLPITITIIAVVHAKQSIERMSIGDWIIE